MMQESQLLDMDQAKDDKFCPSNSVVHMNRIIGELLPCVGATVSRHMRMPV